MVLTDDREVHMMGMLRGAGRIALVLVALLPATVSGNTWEALTARRMTPRVLTYKTVDGVALRLQVYAPTDAGSAPHPAVLLIHGGGWSSPGPWHLMPHARYFAERGMVAVTVEYRLVQDDPPVRMGDCLADCRDALATLRREAAALGIDADRIAVAGDSAGGHLAAALALLPAADAAAATAPPNALLLLNAPLDLETIPWMATHKALAPLPGVEERDGDSPQTRARRYSPMAHVRPGLPPTLLIHGDRDEVVAIEQSEQFARELRRHRNSVTFHRMRGWKHAFVIEGYGSDDQIVETLRMMDGFLAGLGYLEGEPTIEKAWAPPATHALFSGRERMQPHVQARSHDVRFWPFLDGQWLGIVNDPDGATWFSFSTHCGTDHAQLFRYDPVGDRVQHIADLGQATGEKLTGHPPQDKIHGEMFVDGDYVLAGTCEGHAIVGNPYRGGYWLKINRHTGEVTNLGMSVSEDGLLCVGYDPLRRRLYGHTNRKGWLTRLDLDEALDPAGPEQVVGTPWQDVIDAWEADDDPAKPREIWPRGLTLMISADGRVFGVKRPPGTFWEYQPANGALSTFTVEMPLPAELQALADAGEEPDERTRKQWEGSAFHLTLWNETDQCFYLIRSFDQMLCRFFPPADGRPARLELLHEMGLAQRRFNLRPASCTLVISGRTAYYTPHTGWGGVTHLTSYQLDTGTFTDHGPIVVEGSRRVNECHAMVAAPDGTLHLAAFVFSKADSGDPVNPWGMRDKYPFHSRFVIIDPATDFDPGMGE